MTKRIKHVAKTPMVAHLWAHKSQDWARNQCGNFYFQGDTIYSYGSHFPLARHVIRNGENAVLLTTRKRSVTTSGHVGEVTDACRHLTVFHVSGIFDNNQKNLSNYKERYKEIVRKYSRARQRKPEHLAALHNLVEEANGYAEFFGLRTRLTLPDDLTAMIAECQAIDKRERKWKQREERRRLHEAQERLQDWVDGKHNDLWTRDSTLPTRLRIKGDELQTSRGASVPLKHAIKAFRVIKRFRDKGEGYKYNRGPIRIGHFMVDSIDTNGNVKAGCHNIEWSEIERVAKLAGVA